MARRAQAHGRGPALGRQHADDGRRLHPRAHDLRPRRPGRRPPRGGPRADPRAHAHRDGHLPALGEDGLLRRPHAHGRARQGELRAARALRDRARRRPARPQPAARGCPGHGRPPRDPGALRAPGLRDRRPERPHAGLLPRDRTRRRPADPRGAVRRQAAVRAARRPRRHGRAGPLLSRASVACASRTWRSSPARARAASPGRRSSWRSDVPLADGSAPLVALLRFALFVAIAIVAPGIGLQRLARVRWDPALVVPLGLVACALAYWLALVSGVPLVFPVLVLAVGAGSLLRPWATQGRGPVAAGRRAPDRRAGRALRDHPVPRQPRRPERRLPARRGRARRHGAPRRAQLRAGGRLPAAGARLRRRADALPRREPPGARRGRALGGHPPLRRAEPVRHHALGRWRSSWRCVPPLPPRASAGPPWRLAGFVPLASDLSFVPGLLRGAEWWGQRLGDNFLEPVFFANSIAPAVAIALAAIVALARAERGEGRGYLVLAAVLAVGAGFFKVFTGAQLVLALGLAWLLGRGRRRLLVVLVPAALALVALALSSRAPAGVAGVVRRARAVRGRAAPRSPPSASRSCKASATCSPGSPGSRSRSGCAWSASRGPGARCARAAARPARSRRWPSAAGRSPCCSGSRRIPPSTRAPTSCRRAASVLWLFAVPALESLAQALAARGRGAGRRPRAPGHGGVRGAQGGPARPADRAGRGRGHGRAAGGELSGRRRDHAAAAELRAAARRARRPPRRVLQLPQLLAAVRHRPQPSTRGVGSCARSSARARRPRGSTSARALQGRFLYLTGRQKVDFETASVLEPIFERDGERVYRIAALAPHRLPLAAPPADPRDGPGPLAHNPATWPRLRAWISS